MLVDTSLVVRYLVGEPAEQAAQAAEILDDNDNATLSVLVLAESAYVLTSVYGIDRDVVVDHLIALLQKENIGLVDIGEDLAFEALLLCRPSRRVSFTDALLWATARSAGIPRIATFDRRFPADGLELFP